MRYTVLAILAMTAAAVHGREPVHPPDVVVYLNNDGSATYALESAARAEVTRIFGEVGISVGWEAGKPRVSGPGGPIVVRARIINDAPEEAPATALAYTRPFQGGIPMITVIYERIEPMTVGRGRLGPAILAHSFAHELTHVLQVTDRHSQTGMMKAVWTVRDYGEMEFGSLPFSSVDVYLLQQGMGLLRSRNASAHGVAAH